MDHEVDQEVDHEVDQEGPGRLMIHFPNFPAVQDFHGEHDDGGGNSDSVTSSKVKFLNSPSGQSQSARNDPSHGLSFHFPAAE